MLQGSRRMVMETGLVVAGFLLVTTLSAQNVGAEKAVVDAFSSVIVGTAAFFVLFYRH